MNEIKEGLTQFTDDFHISGFAARAVRYDLDSMEEAVHTMREWTRTQMFNTLKKEKDHKDQQVSESGIVTLLCDFCGAKLGEEYWDIDKFGYYRDCSRCKKQQQI